MTRPTPEILTPIFSSRLGREVEVHSVERGPVGNGQEVWFVSLTGSDTEYVLRRTAPGGPLQWTDRDVEFRTLEAVHAIGLPVPRALWHEPAGGELGDAYFVMTRMPGAPAARARGGEAETIAADIGRHLARLHEASLDPARTAVDATRAELSAWRRRYRAERAVPIPMIDALLSHLERTAPEGDQPAALLWGDAGPHNALHRDGAATALLDWELSHLGDPHDDLGSLAWYYGGRPEFDVARAAYEEEAGTRLDPDRIRYFEVMACVTRSIMLVNAIAHYVSGETDAPNLAGLGLHLVPMSLLRAGRLLGWDEPGAALTESATPDPERLRPDADDLLEGTIRFLRDTVLPSVEEPVVRRGLRTTGALLATAIVRSAADRGVGGARSKARAALLEELALSGVDTSGGFAAAVGELESGGGRRDLKRAVRSHLMGEIATMHALAEPLNELYGR